MANGLGKNWRYWRVRSLILVNLYILTHLVFWYGLNIRPWGKTAMSGIVALMIGNINAATVVVVLIFLSLFWLGRAFCGWACHLRSVVEFGDSLLAKWKMGERELKNTRYHWLLRALTLYVVLLPAGIYVVKKGFHLKVNMMEPHPLSDFPGTTDELFYKMAPINWVISQPTWSLILVVGCLVVGILSVMSITFSYFYGPGAFCRILCPYSALFASFLNLSPFQKKITRVNQCTGCRTCSKNCPQGIDVSREIFLNGGKINNRDCIKCYTCVDGCTHGVLQDTAAEPAAQERALALYQKEKLSTVKTMQKQEAVPIWADLLSLLCSILLGAATSYFGAFFYFVGAVIGFIFTRRLLMLGGESGGRAPQRS